MIGVRFEIKSSNFKVHHNLQYHEISIEYAQKL
jgi:hypothetical protein